jgi:hypothetical protein
MPTLESLLSPGLRYGLEHGSLTCWIICGVLALLSIISWAVILSKRMLITRVHKANLSFLREFRESNHPLELFQKREHHEFAAFYHIYHAACREMAWYLLGEDEPGETFAARLQGAGRITPSQMSAVQNAMERSVAEAALRLEARMSLGGHGAERRAAAGPAGHGVGPAGCLQHNDAPPKRQPRRAGTGCHHRARHHGAGPAGGSAEHALLQRLVNRIRGMVVRLDNFASELSAGSGPRVCGSSLHQRDAAQHGFSGRALHAGLQRGRGRAVARLCRARMKRIRTGISSVSSPRSTSLR